MAVKFNKYFRILTFAIIAIYIVIMINLTVYGEKNRQCTDISIVFSDDIKQNFLSKNDIKTLLYKKFDKIVGYPADSINLAKIEEYLNSTPYIKHANVYLEDNGVLTMTILRRKPVVRIKDLKNNDYYIDNEGVILPKANLHSFYITIANGHISGYFDFTKDTVYKVSAKQKIVNDIYRIAKYIEKKDFWKSQIEQIYINDKKDIILVPKVGMHVIEFGETDSLERKFCYLQAFYKKALNKLGWNKYEKISLKYKNQIVCTLKDE